MSYIARYVYFKGNQSQMDSHKIPVTCTLIELHEILRKSLGIGTDKKMIIRVKPSSTKQPSYVLDSQEKVKSMMNTFCKLEVELSELTEYKQLHSQCQQAQVYPAAKETNLSLQNHSQLSSCGQSLPASGSQSRDHHPNLNFTQPAIVPKDEQKTNLQDNCQDQNAHFQTNLPGVVRSILKVNSSTIEEAVKLDSKRVTFDVVCQFCQKRHLMSPIYVYKMNKNFICCDECIYYANKLMPQLLIKVDSLEQLARNKQRPTNPGYWLNSLKTDMKIRVDHIMNKVQEKDVQ